MLSILIRTVLLLAATLALVVAQSQGTDDGPRLSVAVDGHGYLIGPEKQAALPGADALFTQPRTDFKDPSIDPVGIEVESEGIVLDDDNEVAASLLPVTRRADGGSTGYWDTPSSVSEEGTKPEDDSMGSNWDTQSSASEEGTKPEDDSMGSNWDTQSSASEEATGPADDSSNSDWDAPSSASEEVTGPSDDSSSSDWDAPSSASEEVSGAHSRSHGARDAATSGEELAAASSDEEMPRQSHEPKRHKFHKATGIYRVSELENNKYHKERNHPDIIDWTSIPKNEPFWKEKEGEKDSTTSKSKEGSLHHKHSKPHHRRHDGHEKTNASKSQGEAGHLHHKPHKGHHESHDGYAHTNASESQGEAGRLHHKNHKGHDESHHGHEHANASQSKGEAGRLHHKPHKGHHESHHGHEHTNASESGGEGRLRHKHRKSHHGHRAGHEHANAPESSGDEGLLHHENLNSHHGHHDGHKHANASGSSSEEGNLRHKHRKSHHGHHDGHKHANASGSSGEEGRLRHKHRKSHHGHRAGHEHANAPESSGKEGLLHNEHHNSHHGYHDGHKHANAVGSVRLGHTHLHHHQGKSKTQEDGSDDLYNPEALPELTESGDLTSWRYSDSESIQKALDTSKGFVPNAKRPMALAQADTYYVLKHASGACLTSAGDMLVVTWSCDSNSGKQLFKMEQIGNSSEFMIKQRNGRCLKTSRKGVILSAECDKKTAAFTKTPAAKSKGDGLVFRNARNKKCISFKPDKWMPAEGAKLYQTWYHCNKKKWERRAFALVLQGQSIEVKNRHRTNGRYFGALAHMKNQKVQCPAAQVLSAWTLQAEWWKRKFHIDYTCFTPAGGLGACSTKKTTETFGKTNVSDLEKHKVICEKGSALQHWQVNVLSGTYVQAEYTCCQLQAGIDISKCVEGKTRELWDPRHMTQNLDGSMLQCEDGQAMSSWHFAKQKKRKVLFDYECCPLKAPSGKLPAPTPVQAPAATPSKAPSGGFSIKSLDPEPPGDSKDNTKNNKQKDNHEKGKSDEKKGHDENVKDGEKNETAGTKKRVYLQKIYEYLKKIRNQLKKGERKSSNKETPKNKSKVIKIIINTMPKTNTKIKTTNDLLGMISDELKKLPAHERRKRVKEWMRSAGIYRDKEEQDTTHEENAENSTEEMENITSTNKTGNGTQSNSSFSIKSLEGPVYRISGASPALAATDEEVIDKLKNATQDAEEALDQYKKAPQGKASKGKDPTTPQNKLIDDLKNATANAEEIIGKLSLHEPQVNSTTAPSAKETKNKAPRGLVWDDWGSPDENGTHWSSWTFKKPKGKRSFSDVRLMHRLGSHWHQTMDMDEQ